MGRTEDLMKKKMIRNTRTRRALIEAFRVIVNQKDYGKITVREITELAEVNRNSFYNYFKNIEDMLNDIVYERIQNCYYDEETDTWLDQEMSKSEIIAFFEENREFLASVFADKQEVSTAFFLDLCNTLLQQAAKSGLLELDHNQRVFLAGGFSTLLTDWLFYQSEVPPRDFIEDLYRRLPNWLRETMQ